MAQLSRTESPWAVANALKAILHIHQASCLHHDHETLKMMNRRQRAGPEVDSTATPL
jgi:hypothetical protein